MLWLLRREILLIGQAASHERWKPVGSGLESTNPSPSPLALTSISPCQFPNPRSCYLANHQIECTRWGEQFEDASKVQLISGALKGFHSLSWWRNFILSWALSRAAFTHGIWVSWMLIIFKSIQDEYQVHLLCLLF